MDSDPTTDGLYEGAILSSSIEFSGGYVSTVDFAGGDIGVGLGINNYASMLALTPPNDTSQGFGITAPNSIFNSDELLTDPGVPFGQDQNVLFLLFEPNGVLINTVGTFEVLAVPEPSAAFFLGIGVLSTLARRQRSGLAN